MSDKVVHKIELPNGRVVEIIEESEGGPYWVKDDWVFGLTNVRAEMERVLCGEIIRLTERVKELERANKIRECHEERGVASCHECDTRIYECHLK